MKRAIHLTLILVVCGVLSVARQTSDAAPAPTAGRSGAVATSHYLASEAGLGVLRSGGNAVDAAVAAALALSVVQQLLSGIGGDGAALIFLAARQEVIAISFLGRAPLAATPAAMGSPEEWRTGYKSAVVPGVVAGLLVAHERFGRLPLPAVVQPAIRLAGGFPATEGLVRAILDHAALLSRDPESSRIYFPGGRPPRTGETFAQPDLQRTLETIAAGGRQAFYEGPIADALVKAMAERGGLITKDDLARYQPGVGAPVRITYRGHEVLSVLPPAGGVEVLESLKILEGFEIGRLPEADRLHVIASVLRIAFADGTAYKGDAAVTRYPVEALISDAYAERRRRDIVMEAVPPSFVPGSPTDLGVGRVPTRHREPIALVGTSTSHLVTADRDGNVVSLTQTVVGGWGSGVTIPGTGVVLNNAMPNFSARPDSPRRLVGGSVRSSSMAPTIILREGRPVLLAGAAGDAMIIAAVVQIVTNAVDLGMPVEAAVAAGRVMPGEGRRLLVEGRISLVVRQALEAKGYQTEPVSAIARAQAIQVVGGVYQGVTDPRSPGAAYGY